MQGGSAAVWVIAPDEPVLRLEGTGATLYAEGGCRDQIIKDFGKSPKTELDYIFPALPLHRRLPASP
ncbi:hypothetical protein NDU88_004987 [Pleurodeles waltl]|uniref:Uncharacterized protein n=1 Tax=Pleurodeles waltl TaxID=8319 RepID=A0AAV7WWB9_PLEWA|nr:hypothetical protein NDU88_004987 [Pleurodeles waltl]